MPYPKACTRPPDFSSVDLTLWISRMWAGCAHLTGFGGEKRLIRWPPGQHIGRTGGPRIGSGAPEYAGQIAQLQPRHLVLERAERDAEIACRCGDVPVGLLERAQNEIAFE